MPTEPAGGAPAGDGPPSGVDAGAIGFDLDHTLAIYRDERVARLAWTETLGRLCEAGTPGARRLPRAFPERAAMRGLWIDFSTGALCKTNASGDVRLESDDTRAAPALPAKRRSLPFDTRVIHPIGSFFDVPTAAFFAGLAPYARRARSDRAALCGTIRAQLDASHTAGRFKGRILETPQEYLLPSDIRPGSIARCRDAGRTLFVLTNSDVSYACSILDFLFDGIRLPHWSEVFAFVFADAGKPDFFRARGSLHPAFERGTCAVFSGGGAEAVEHVLGLSPHRILYAGDHPIHDLSPSRSRGWRVAAVVPELLGPGEGPWGNALTADAGPSWLFAATCACADMAEGSAGRLVDTLIAT